MKTRALSQLRLGTRGSPLALAQASETKARLLCAHGWDEPQIPIMPIRTSGDALQDRALSEAGGKGLFTKELDIALLEQRIDLAVHSAKDLPTRLPEGLEIAGYLPREDARDVLISLKASSLEGLAQGAVVGTASLRREAQLKRLRPDLQITLLRGNVGTRLDKIEGGAMDATLLALAGMKRLKLENHVTCILDPHDFLPAVGQGAIAIVTRAGDDAVQEALSLILDEPTGYALAAERAFLAVLDGSCRTPIAGHAIVAEGRLQFKGLLLSPDGRDAVETMRGGSVEDAEHLGEDAGEETRRLAGPGLLPAMR